MMKFGALHLLRGICVLALPLVACADDAAQHPALDAGREPPDEQLVDAEPTVDASAPTWPDARTQPSDAGPPGEDATTEPVDAAPPWHPGPQPWPVVPEDEVLASCQLDPQALAAADTILQTPWAVIRHGKLCHQYLAEGMTPRAAWSATKTLGALVTGIVAYETRTLPRVGRKTGPLSDDDRVDVWLDSFSYNPDARVAHVLGMIAHNPDLTYGHRSMEYDTLGNVQLNSLSAVMSAAIAQDRPRLGDNLEQFTQRFLFQKLGLAHSSWSAGHADKVLGFSWETDVFDMAKVGWLMLQGGIWNGERLLSEEWVYRMVHPSFEDANTGYGYLTWLNASTGWSVGIADTPSLPIAVNPGPCAPVAVHKQFPHGLSEATSCLYSAPYSCVQQYDVGVWQAVGLFGQVIQGHPGLDMVVVGMDLTIDEPLVDGMLRNSVNPSARLWDALKPAVIKGDPVYRGDEAAFCAAYGGNHYAPDLRP